jgi:hypothetical protein
MQTIRIPKNLLFLSDKLPQPNYEKKINNSGELPEIRQINQKKKAKNRENQQDNNDNNSNSGEPQIASIKKKHAREISSIENNINHNNNQIKNSIIYNEEENNIITNKVIDKKEKSPSG